MHTHLAIIITKRIKETKNRTCQNKGKCLVTYVSEPQRLAMVLSTLFGDGRTHLASNNYGNYVVFQVSFNFFAPFVLFRKTVARTDKTVHNKGPGQVSPYSDNAFFRNKAANSGHSRAAQPNCLENRFILEYCTG